MTLLLSALVAVLLTIGVVLAVRGQYRAHRWFQTGAATLNAILVLWLMVLPFRDFVVITGSMNFSDNAADSNDENVIAIADPAIGRLYREEFIRRWGDATTPDIECEE